jgi:hypothetical protein
MPYLLNDKKHLEEVLSRCTQVAAAKELGCGKNTVERAIKRLGIHYERKTGLCGPNAELLKSLPKELSPDQKDIVTGSLLGDAYVSKSKFWLRMKSTREEYVKHIRECLLPFSMDVFAEKRRKPSKVNGVINHDIENWGGEYSYSATFYTRSVQIFRSLRDQWYPDGYKRVPQDLKLNSKICAHWFVQDGSNSVDRHSIALHTESFSEKEVEFLILRLKEDMGIDSTMQIRSDTGQPIIFIGNASNRNGYLPFLNIVSPHIPYECFKYKIRIDENYDTARRQSVFTEDEVTEMRELRKKGWLQREIADKFATQQGTISAILNNKTHKN